ncbi:hypothetical protein M569_11417, partial [Genlisea aurea]
GAGTEQFESYFQRADLDRDGRISGSEAVAFFRGSNLPQDVLAKIWTFADQNRVGFLSRTEFYNALKLVTVAQSKRELTPDIVKAALYSPASAKIPAPQINLGEVTARQQPNLAVSAPPSQANAAVSSQGFGFRGQFPATVNQQFPSASLNTGMNQQPSTPSWTASASETAQSGGDLVNTAVGPGAAVSNVARKSDAASAVVMNTGPRPSTSLVSSNSLNQLSSLNSAATDGGANGLSGSLHKSTSDPNVSSTSELQTSQFFSGQEALSRSLPTQSTVVQQKVDPFEALQSNLLKPSSGFHASQSRSLPKSNQQVHTIVASSPVPPSSATGIEKAEQSQESWQKMTRSSIQKYAKVFMEVDTGRIGKISGEQARKLFLSWRLPREVLKQIWDLSDQDSDSMLTLREFCIALYLMERYREGRVLPTALPQSVMLDETLSSLAGPPVSYGWGQASGFRAPQASPGPQTFPSPGLIPPAQQSIHNNARGVVMDNSQTVSNGEENPVAGKPHDGDEIKEKAENDENVLLDSREKLEFYRTKMQDLVLYKSRCDNRLNEITERARADKAEAEGLEKKYQEKYKQVAEVHSKLTLEEASFREVQERRAELQQAIIKIEQGGSADGILQVRADRIQSDLEVLLKALADQFKKHDLQMKSTTLIELPTGWTPGVPEAALLWDEEWDKFEDEGFGFDVGVPENGKPSSPDSVLHDDSTTSEKPPFASLEAAFDTESAYSGGAHGSPSEENHSEGDADTHRFLSCPLDESSTTWGNFDNNDDIDSVVWGFNSKDTDDDHGKLEEEKNFFGSNAFAGSPERDDDDDDDNNPSPKKTTFMFEDSSPSRLSLDSRDPFYNSFSRYDSSSAPREEGSSSSPREGKLARFDSVGSSSKYSFDDSDPFGSTGPFKVSSDEVNTTK